MRKIPAELVQRYHAEGWWTQDTIGDLLARGLQAAPSTPFRVHSEQRPWSGTFGEVERVARRLAGGPAGARRRPGRRGRVPAAELDGGRRGLLGVGVPRCGGRADRPLLRAQGARLHPRRGRAPRLRHRASASAGWSSSRTCVPTCPSSGWSAATSTTCWPGADARRARRRPGRPSPDRLHLGDDPRPQGRHPQSPDARLRDPPAGRAPTRPTVGSAAHRGSGRPLHRHAQRVPDPGARRQPGEPGRRLEPGPGPGADAPAMA